MLKQWQCWRQWHSFNQLPEEKREIVFYSEGHAYWVHFEPMIQSLVYTHQKPLSYLTSERNDPIFQKHIPGVHAFWIGDGFVRTLAFRTLKAKLCVLTMPDLENFYLKRSVHPVHYAYVFHSLVSTHRIYRHAALDHYDSILCCGPHHIEEIRQTEKKYDLRHKHLLKHGYGRLDSILHSKKSSIYENKVKARRILVAPSWGKDSLLQNVGVSLILTLLKNNFEVVLRPHPQTLRDEKHMLTSLIKQFKKYPEFHFETDVTTQSSLFSSSIMISDWSGAALDFALGLEKPVLFIDVPAKTNNPHYDALGLPTLEDKIRSEIGKIVLPDSIEKVPALLEEMLRESDSYRENIVSARRRWVFHLGQSGKTGADLLLSLVDDVKNKTNDI